MPIFFALPAQADWRIKPIFDLRERFERRLDKDFSEEHQDNKSDLLSRWRAGIAFSYKKQFSGQIVYQYAHDLFWTAASNGSEERSDLLLGYVDFKAMDGKVRLGRQQLVKGSQRLVGPGEWGNTARSWDMARYSVGRWDAFFGKLAVNSAPSRDALLGGFSYGSKYGETMMLYRHDKHSGTQDDIYTLDHTYKYKVGKFSADLEVAGQAGRTADSKLEAWASSLRVNYQHDAKTKFYVEGNAASGGTRGDTSLTFDQFYATNHTKYGILDAQGWRNMKGLTLGVNYKPTKALSLNAEYHRFGLWAADDAWYSDGGKPNKGDGFTFKDATGSKGTDVGGEIDFWGSYELDKHSAFEAGISWFKPGAFIKAFAGAGNQDQVYGYVQYRIKF